MVRRRAKSGTHDAAGPAPVLLNYAPQLRAARAICAMSREELAEVTGVSRNTIHRLETDSDGDLSEIGGYGSTLRKLEDYFAHCGITFESHHFWEGEGEDRRAVVTYSISVKHRGQLTVGEIDFLTKNAEGDLDEAEIQSLLSKYRKAPR